MSTGKKKSSVLSSLPAGGLEGAVSHPRKFDILNKIKANSVIAFSDMQKVEAFGESNYRYFKANIMYFFLVFSV